MATPRGTAGSSLTPRSSNQFGATLHHSSVLSRSLQRDQSKPNPFQELSAPKFDHFVNSVKLKIKLALQGPALDSPTPSDVFGAVKQVEEIVVDSKLFLSLFVTLCATGAERELIRWSQRGGTTQISRFHSNPFSKSPILISLSSLCSTPYATGTLRAIIRRRR